MSVLQRHRSIHMRGCVLNVCRMPWITWPLGQQTKWGVLYWQAKPCKLEWI